METLTPTGIEIYGPDMLGQTTEGFVPFSVRCPNFIQLNDHTIVYFFEAKYASQLDEEPSCRVLMRSHNGGKTWGETRLLRYEALPFCPGGTPIYDSVHDTLIYFCRTRHWKPGMEQDRLLNENDQIEGRTYERFWISKSTDGGLSWSEFRGTFIETPDTWTIYHCPSPGIGIQLKTQKDPAKNGRLIMPCNHAKHENGENEWGAHLLISDDFGDTWHMGATDSGKTYREIRQLSGNGTFAAYSAIYATMEGQLLCAWESGPDFNQYRDIKYTVLDMEDLIRKIF